MNRLLLFGAFLSTLIIGFFIGTKITLEPSISNAGSISFSKKFNKLNEIVGLINNKYVDSIDINQIQEDAINDLLSELDPHSSYSGPVEFKAMNETLEGNFEGIGVEFHLLNDTILVVSAISGGPSEEIGIRSGDKIIRINGQTVAGTGMKNTDVVQKLRGEGGTKVTVTILRNGQKARDYQITRGQIPLNSIDVAYMLNDTEGYIKLTKFSATTEDEFEDALIQLKAKGMKELILDLRGNGGGYLNAAIAVSDQFLDDKKLIVYTQGRKQPRQDFYATSKGLFEKGKLFILIDEGSASASEIVTGAVQDWDRGTVIGRRSFGKGLVQDQTMLRDGSALRLTIARYFTPTGRSIQKSYSNGIQSYNEDLNERLKNGQLLSADSVHFSDSLKFTTPGGKVVYGGGGIMPDIFVSLDTTGFSGFYGEVSARGIINEYAYELTDRSRKKLSSYKNIKDFINEYNLTESDMNDFVNYAKKRDSKINLTGLSISTPTIKNQLKALIARQLFKDEGFYRVIQSTDPVIKKAMN